MSTPSSTTNAKIEAAIHVDHIAVRFGKNLVLEDISFEVPEGSISAIIGPNGSGKTTLLRAMLNLVPHEGIVRFHGKNIQEVRDQIGYVPQRFQFDPHFPITVEEFLELTCEANKCSTARHRTLELVGLHNEVLDQKIGTLSGGQLQRILIAQAIINEPSYLLLDEPSTGIDIVGETQFYEVIRNLNTRLGTTIILVSHDVSMVSKSIHNVICVNKRLLCTGPPRKALTQKKLAELYGDEGMDVYKHHHG